MGSLYDSPEWRAVADAAKRRDGRRCTVNRLLGGRCRGPLHAHHIEPVSEGGSELDLDNVGTACASHHPRWEALRRAIVYDRRRDVPRCPHEHRTPEAREICERRLARKRSRELVAA